MTPTGLAHDPNAELLWSACSTWEFATKTQLGKLRIGSPLETFVARVMAEQRLEGLPVQQRHAARIADLPPIHRDPFDRMLVAQALVENVPLLTADARLTSYGARCLPA